MFYLLKCTYVKKRSLFSRLFSSGITVTAHRKKGVNYYLIEMLVTKDIDWFKLERVIGKNQKIVLPKGLKTPSTVTIKAYPTEDIKGRLLGEGALRVVEQAAKQNPSLSVMLIDQSGKYNYLLTPLMRAAQTVTAVTADKENYSQSARCLLNTLGASPLITDSTQRAAACSVIIAPDGISGCGTLPLPTTIFAAGGSDFLSIEEENIDLGSMNDLDWADKFQLAAALAEEPDFSGTLPYARSMKRGNQSLSLAQIAEGLL